MGAWAFAWMVAFPAVLLVRPFVQRMTDRLTIPQLQRLKKLKGADRSLGEFVNAVRRVGDAEVVGRLRDRLLQRAGPVDGDQHRGRS